MSKIHSKIISVIVAGLTLLFIMGCAEPEGPVGSSIAGDNGGELVTSVFYADQDTSMAFPQDHTGQSPYLYVGSAYGITSQALIRFEQAVTPHEWTVDSSRIELTFQGSIGSGNYPGLSVYILDYEWSETDTIDLDEIIPDGGESVFSVESIGDSGAVILDDLLNNEYLTGWLNWIDSSAIDTNWVDSSRTDSGISLFIWSDSDDNVERLIRFQSRSANEDSVTQLRPRLFLFLTVRDSADGELHPDTLEIIASDDLYQVEYDTSVGADQLLIGSTAVYRSFLHFNISPVDTSKYHIVVNKSTLTLNSEPIDISLPVTRAVRPFRLAGETIGEFRESELKSITNSSTAIDTSSAEVRMLVSAAVTAWVTGIDPNGWISLQSGAPGIDIDRIGFYSSDADSALRPALTISYTRFER